MSSLSRREASLLVATRISYMMREMKALPNLMIRLKVSQGTLLNLKISKKHPSKRILSFPLRMERTLLLLLVQKLQLQTRSGVSLKIFARSTSLLCPKTYQPSKRRSQLPTP
jgi:hypothetical protein